MQTLKYKNNIIMPGTISRLEFVLITNRKICKSGLTEVVRQAAAGGIGAVQLREKDLNTKDLYTLAKGLREITEELNLNLIVNDRADIAMAIDADGVHLGWQSLDIKTVRNIVGDKKLIGFSAHNLQEAIMAHDEGADYITISPVFKTSYKDYSVSPLGVVKIKEIKEQVNIPVIALGGINENNVDEVLGNGADGIAVMSTVLLSENPSQTAGRLYDKIRRFKNVH